MGMSPEERRRALEAKMRQRKEALGQRMAERRARLDDRLGKAPTPAPREAASPQERPPAAPVYPGTDTSQLITGHRPEVNLPAASRVTTIRAPRVPVGPPEVQKGLRIAAMLLVIAGFVGAGVLLQRYVLTPDATQVGEDTPPIPLPDPDSVPEEVPVPAPEPSPVPEDAPAPEETPPDTDDLSVAQVYRAVDQTANQAFGISEMGLILPPIREAKDPREFASFLVSYHSAPAEVSMDLLQRYTSDGSIQEAIFAAYLPKAGVIIRTWDLENLERREGFALVIREQWGHGLLAQYSGVGIERTALGLDYVALRDFMEGVYPASGQAQAREEGARMVARASGLAQVGYSAWIEHFMLEQLKAGGVLEEGGYTVPSLEQIASFLRGGGDTEILDALSDVFTVEPGMDPEEIHERTVHLQGVLEMNGELFQEYFGLPASYLIGYHLYEQFAERWGSEGVPLGAITALACHYGLDQIALEDLEEYLKTDYRLNPDSRLVLLALGVEPEGMLATRRYSGKQMKTFFVDTLKSKTKLAVPEALRK